MTTFISVNRQTIAKNAKHGTNDPPVRLAKSRKGAPTGHCSELAILDAAGNEVARLIYDAGKPILKCGARLAIEALHGVKVVR